MAQTRNHEERPYHKKPEPHYGVMLRPVLKEDYRDKEEEFKHLFFPVSAKQSLHYNESGKKITPNRKRRRELQKGIAQEKKKENVKKGKEVLIKLKEQHLKNILELKKDISKRQAKRRASLLMRLDILWGRI